MNAALAAQLLRGSLGGSPVRLALTLACIALGVALAAAVHTIHTSALAEVDRAARALAGAADLEVQGPRYGFDDAIFEAIAARPGVQVASPILDVDATVPGREAPLRVLGIDIFRALRMQPAFALGVGSTGPGPATGLLDAGGIWLSPSAAARLGRAPGDTLALLSGRERRELRVAGLLSGLKEGGELAVMDIAAAQVAFDRVGRLTRIELRLARGTNRAAFREALAKELPPGLVASEAASVSSRAASITRAYRVNLDALAIVAIATGAFLVFSTLAMQAARRRAEFALLRALGITRRGLSTVLALEGALVGAVGSALGLALGLAASRFLLEEHGADLGAGFFAGSGESFAPDPMALGAIALLATALCVAASLAVGRGVARMAVADALRDRAIDLPRGGARMGLAAIGAFALGIPLLFAPPVGGLPIAGYAVVALWLLASVLAVGPVSRAALERLQARRDPVAALAIAQVRELPGHLAASISGVVVSAALCVAMAIMVFSFRASLADWLGGVVGADLYARPAESGDTAWFTAAEERAVAALPGVRSVEPIRYERVTIDERSPALTLVSRPITARVLEAFGATPTGAPPEAGATPVPVWISEAARDLHDWRTGDAIALPIEGRRVPARVAGVIRDYGRTWGSMLFPLEAYRRITGEARSHNLAIHLAPGADRDAVKAALRATLGRVGSLEVEDSAAIRERSIAIFDRTFAVTYAMEAIAVVIGMAGITSSFAALAWARRREFGVLRFLGLTRREVLRLLALEGAAAGALGGAIGLAAGVAMSGVLVQVINRQSFHWTIEIHWPWLGLALLFGAVVATCAIGARLSGAFAVRQEAVLAVKDDA